MKQIIPFVKDITFASKIYEITSIALEHNLKMENNDSIVGNFIISGKYKMNSISINEELFDEIINFDITLDDKYDASKIEIDIDNFYYEIVNEEYLRVHIDVLLDNLVYAKKDERNEVKIEESKEIEINDNNIEERCTHEELPNYLEKLSKQDTKQIEEINMVVENAYKKEDYMNKQDNIKMPEEIKQEKTDILSDELSTNFLSNEEKYVTYKVHIIRENETIETVKELYGITKEELEKYNNLENIIQGSKIIVPLDNE